MICRCLSLLREIPISSAQALTIPALRERRMLSKLVRNGAMALLKRKAEAGHPCKNTRGNCEQIYGYSSVCIDSTSILTHTLKKSYVIRRHFLCRCTSHIHSWMTDGKAASKSNAPAIRMLLLLQSSYFIEYILQLESMSTRLFRKLGPDSHSL